MKFLVDEMPAYPYECPFMHNNHYCKCGDNVCDCEYFKMGRDPYYCNWLKEKDDE